MSGRIGKALAARKAEGGSALIVYLTFGDPDLSRSEDIVRSVAANGADIIELGIPFSDPSADGVVIQRAMERALEQGASLRKALDAIQRLREHGEEVPLVLFGYYNPIVSFGVERFAEACGRAGLDAVLTVDVPMDELNELHDPLSKCGVGVVPLVAPTSTSDRIQRVAAFEPPFVYYISLTGVTGSSIAVDRDIGDRVAEVRRATEAPVAVGFGVRTASDARAVARVADAVVVGSAVIERIEAAAPENAAAEVGAFVADLRSAIDSA